MEFYINKKEVQAADVFARFEEARGVSLGDNYALIYGVLYKDCMQSLRIYCKTETEFNQTVDAIHKNNPRVVYVRYNRKVK